MKRSIRHRFFAASSRQSAVQKHTVVKIDKPTILDLPLEVLAIAAEHLDINSLQNFMNTCHTFNNVVTADPKIWVYAYNNSQHLKAKVMQTPIEYETLPANASLTYAQRIKQLLTKHHNGYALPLLRGVANNQILKIRKNSAIYIAVLPLLISSIFTWAIVKACVDNELGSRAVLAMIILGMGISLLSVFTLACLVLGPILNTRVEVRLDEVRTGLGLV